MRAVIWQIIDTRVEPIQFTLINLFVIALFFALQDVYGYLRTKQKQLKAMDYFITVQP